MKKTLLKIVLSLALIVAVCVGMVACGGSSWDESNVSLNTITAETGVQGGMVAETENYVYFINGKASAEDDNSLGAPIKGALYAADKSDLTKQSIVVPKLFVASDYKAGVYIYGGYVYYGTPSTDKNSSGEIAKDELVFAKTTLDGTGTEILFNAGAISTEYRIVKGADGVVYIVYYDNGDSAIKCFNTSTKSSIEVAKTDEEAELESLDAHLFATNEGINDVVVYYTTKLYSADYDEEEAKSEDYQRATFAYNKLYAYKAGEQSAVCVLDGKKAVFETYSLSKVFGKYVEYSVAKNDGANKTENYVVEGASLYGKVLADSVKITNDKYLAGETTFLVVDVNNAYYVDGDSKNVIKTSLVGTANEIDVATKPVAKGDTVATLFFVDGDYVYYSNNTGDIARIYIGDDRDTSVNENKLKEQTVSEGAVLTDWFAPKLVKWTVNSQEKTCLFYANSSDDGCSYVYCVDVNGEIQAEDTDEDEKMDKWSIKGNARLGDMIDADKAKIVDNEITKLAENLDDSGRIVFDTNSVGEVVLENSEITRVKALYDSYEGTDVYDLITENIVNDLNIYVAALDLSKKLYALNGFYDKTEAEKTALESAYNEAKAAREKLFNDDDSEDHAFYTAVLDKVVVNLNFEYGKAVEFFTAEE